MLYERPPSWVQSMAYVRKHFGGSLWDCSEGPSLGPNSLVQVNLQSAAAKVRHDEQCGHRGGASRLGKMALEFGYFDPETHELEGPLGK